MNKDDIYTRYFRLRQTLPISEAEGLCNVDYSDEVAFLAVTGDPENEKVVGSSGYIVNPSTNMAEVAYMIRSDWQGVWGSAPPCSSAWSNTEKPKA